MSDLMFAFLLTLFAGLSTGLGSALAFFTKKTNTAFLATSLAFSGGVMIYISFVELLAEGREELMSYLGESLGDWVAVAAFFAGILFIGIIDHLVPEAENPHHVWDEEDVEALSEDEMKIDNDQAELHRMGIMSALAIAIHNFPEGLVTFVAALADPALGVTIAIAIAIHNIPEGIAVSVPIYYSTGSKLKGFSYALLSGLAEPLGALAGYFLFRSFFNELVFGIVFAFVAGVMVFISIDELLPTSRKYGEGHQEIYGFVAGMAVMAISLLLL